jgi:hypothetical protein
MNFRKPGSIMKSPSRNLGHLARNTKIAEKAVRWSGCLGGSAQVQDTHKRRSTQPQYLKGDPSTGPQKQSRPRCWQQMLPPLGLVDSAHADRKNRLASDFNRRNVSAELHRGVLSFTAASAESNSRHERGDKDSALHGISLLVSIPGFYLV